MENIRLSKIFCNRPHMHVNQMRTTLFTCYSWSASQDLDMLMAFWDFTCTDWQQGQLLLFLEVAKT